MTAPRLVLLLLIRDEVDLVDPVLQHHLDAGVDALVVTDNGSTDGTVERLEAWRERCPLTLIHEPGRDYDQGAWVTRMAHVAREQQGADLLLPCDADELWLARSGTLRDALPRGKDAAYCPVWNGLPPEAPGASWSWITDPSPPPKHGKLLTDGTRPLPHPWIEMRHSDKVLVRSRRLRRIEIGNHDAHHWGWTRRARADVVVLHRPLRSIEQFARKVENAADVLNNPRSGPGTSWHWKRWVALARQDRLHEAWTEAMGGDALRDDLRSQGRLSDAPQPSVLSRDVGPCSAPRS